VTETLAQVASSFLAAASLAPGDTEKILVEVSRDVVADARRRVPSRTGRLLRSISADAPQRAVGGYEVELGPTKPRGWYGHFVEGGTDHSAAQPYVAPALDAGQKALGDKLLYQAASRVAGRSLGGLL
jgi:HK97 gp10 family phage protein